jgi:HD-like signal output (HDOD) protein
MSSTINNTFATETDSPRVGVLLENAIHDIGIPPCPVILEKIHAEMGQDEPNFNHISHIISSDVAIAASLITIANSPFFGLRNRVRSANEALLMLGLSVTSRAIAGLVLRKLFPSSPSMERFWRASASIAGLSGWLAQQGIGNIKVRADDAYTFGLFRDCGIPLLLKRFSHYPEVLKKANEEEEQTFTAIENALCNTNHAAIGGLLAQSWWLPDDICFAIRHHHDYPLLKQGASGKLSATTVGLIATAHIAEHLFLHHNVGWEQSQEWDKAGPACMQLFDLTDEDLSRLYDESEKFIKSEDKF